MHKPVHIKSSLHQRCNTGSSNLLFSGSLVFTEVGGSEPVLFEQLTVRRRLLRKLLPVLLQLTINSSSGMYAILKCVDSWCQFPDIVKGSNEATSWWPPHAGWLDTFLVLESREALKTNPNGFQRPLISFMTLRNMVKTKKMINY